LENRADIRLNKGDMAGAEADVKESLAIYRTLGKKVREPALYDIYARLLGKQGNCESATRTWEEGFALCENIQLHFRALRMLLGLAELQMQCGQIAALDLTWKRIDKFVADHPSDLAPPTLLCLHLARLEYLKQKGVAFELVAADRAAQSFVASSGLSAYQLRPFAAWTKAFPGILSSLQPRPAIKAPPFRRPELDLQPVFERTRVRTNEAARGYFLLTNPSAEPASADLSVENDSFNCEWVTNQDYLSLNISPKGSSELGNQKLQFDLSPGQQVLLIAECDPLLQQTNHDLAIKLGGSKPQVVHWDFGSEADARTLAVVNASLAEDNPFYSLSLFHEVYFRGEQEQRTNLRVQASEPCRIEIIDPVSHELLAVDANGDGDFEDAGDSIATDLDLNVYPDLIVSPTADVRRFELVVFPRFKENRNPREIEITLSFGAPGSWTTQSVDRLILR
jgi:hypothetical protein